MRLDTLTYKYCYESSPKSMFEALMEEQLKYFNYHDPKIHHLYVGQEISTTLQTKLNKLDSQTKIKITEIKPEKIFQLETHQPDNHNIIQTFEFKKNNKGKNEVVYSEKTKLNNARSYSFFFLAAIVYKFFYNRGMHKKMQYLDTLAMKKVEIA